MTPMLVSAKELGARYSVSPKTIRNWALSSFLPAVRLNSRCLRFDLGECDAVIKRRTLTTRGNP